MRVSVWLTPPPRAPRVGFWESGFFFDSLFPAIESQDTSRGIPGVESTDSFMTIREIAVGGFADVTFLEKGESVNDKHFVEDLAKKEVDIMFSARFQQIFKQDVMDVPRLGIWNAHPGALPKYKGRDTDFHALVSGEPELWMTIHEVTTGIDTGSIHSARSVKVEDGSSLLEHRLKLHEQAFELCISLVDEKIHGKEEQTLKSQEHNEAPYFTFPTPEELDDFETKGYKFASERELQAMVDLFTQNNPLGSGYVGTTLEGVRA